MASTMTEAKITELRQSGYIPPSMLCRAPTKGQVIPTPNTRERVVFASHLMRGFGFPLLPFVRGIRFFYGVDLHDLAHNSLFHLLAFVIVCEAFLQIQPHFGLWLKLFGIKPRNFNGNVPDCGGASVCKLSKAKWPVGTFVETVKVWQVSWFYLTEHRDANWVAAPAFRSRPPTRLVSWTKKGFAWGDAAEVKMLLKGVGQLIDERNLNLPGVIQIMFSHRILPLQRRSKAMWAHKPDDPFTVLNFPHSDRRKMWKTLFKPENGGFSDEGEDRGLNEPTPAHEV